MHTQTFAVMFTLAAVLGGLAFAAPTAVAHENCHSLTPNGCGSCGEWDGPHSHYIAGSQVAWPCYSKCSDFPCKDLIDVKSFRLSAPAFQ